MKSMTRRAVFAFAFAGLMGGTNGRAEAGFIDFDAQAAGRGGIFTRVLDSPLVIGIATFTGGELLNNETSSLDTTGVYATIDSVGGYTDPITITFSAPVSGFSILVTNLFSDSYTVADNLGGSSTAFVGSDHTFTLTDSGITGVTIASNFTSRSNFDFAIDNVSFTSIAVPEPSSLAMCCIAGTIGLAVVRVRRKRSA